MMMEVLKNGWNKFMLKQIILKTGRILVDFSTAIDLFLLISFLLIGTFLTFASDLELNQKILSCSILFLIVLLIFFAIVIIKFIIYLLIDIKDNLTLIVNKESEPKQDISKFLIAFISLFFATIFLGLIISGITYYNSTFLDQKNNFTKIEVTKTIKHSHKYNDKTFAEKFGFMWNDKSKLLIITGIIPNSSAEKAGLKQGDQIIKVNKLDTTTLNVSALKKELKKRKINIAFKRNNTIQNCSLERSAVYVPNLPPELIPALYFNSTKFKNNYALGYFKIPENNGTYKKRGIICDCTPQNKTITTFWDGIYSDNRLIKEHNYLKDDNLFEENIYPNTYGYIMWESLCYLHKESSKK